eukprot:Gregarina_sp_Pseudo_9__4429@NODE_458_length_2800_cov_30_069540_g434_i0_p1_GENE_NODE_458_length_2800_cov_30_069540_g434_i0NODE_458_length_2800_cov_30_069540_g434_i0_p1_ORF_typecomplete_len262_score46_33_NODE_458_length_2800_cov_30_069540_g434_i08191604
MLLPWPLLFVNQSSVNWDLADFQPDDTYACYPYCVMPESVDAFVACLFTGPSDCTGSIKVGVSGQDSLFKIWQSLEERETWSFLVINRVKEWTDGLQEYQAGNEYGCRDEGSCGLTLHLSDAVDETCMFDVSILNLTPSVEQVEALDRCPTRSAYSTPFFMVVGRTIRVDLQSVAQAGEDLGNEVQWIKVSASPSRSKCGQQVTQQYWNTLRKGRMQAGGILYFQATPPDGKYEDAALPTTQNPARLGIAVAVFFVFVELI